MLFKQYRTIPDTIFNMINNRINYIQTLLKYTFGFGHYNFFFDVYVSSATRFIFYKKPSEARAFYYLLSYDILICECNHD